MEVWQSWSIALVLKTSDPLGSRGSNPFASACLTHKLRIMAKNIHFNISECEYRNNLWIIAFDKESGLWYGTLIASYDVEYNRYKHFCNGDKLLKIVRLETSPNHVGEGIASSLMNNFIDSYKDYNIYLLVSPQAREKDTLRSVTDLKKFYEKFGFKKTGELLPTMIRKATLPTLGV